MRRHKPQYAKLIKSKKSLKSVNVLKRLNASLLVKETGTARLKNYNFSNELFKCDPCKTSFGSEVKWARHMQRHKGEPGKS